MTEKEGGPCTLTDPKALEEKLKPYENQIDIFQNMLFWKKPIAMGLLVISVNLLFVLIRVMNLSFMPTLFLLLTINVLIKVVRKVAGDKLNVIFKQIDSKATEGYKIYTLDVICQKFSCFMKKFQSVCPFCPFILGKKELTISTAVLPLGVLSVMFLFFLVVGTFWFNFVVVNMLLLLPAVIMHPVVSGKIQQILGSKKNE